MLVKPGNTFKMQKDSSNYLRTINTMSLCIYKIDDSTQIVREHKNVCHIVRIIYLFCLFKKAKT